MVPATMEDKAQANANWKNLYMVEVPKDRVKKLAYI
jgi:hypothetical protein